MKVEKYIFWENPLSNILWGATLSGLGGLFVISNKDNLMLVIGVGMLLLGLIYGLYSLKEVL